MNHLLFIDDLKLYGSNDNKIDSLVKVVKIVSGDIGMPFGFGKYAVLKMKRGKQVHCEGIDLGDGVVMEEADEEGYKYLGIIKRDDICQKKMKEKVQKEYYKRVMAVLTSKLNGGNVVNAINIWTVATVCNLFDYAANNNERLLKVETEELQLRTKINGKNKEERVNGRQAAWKEKTLNGQLLRETADVRSKEMAVAESR